jgi:peptidoglycan hydrolase-like protein with peptidoglycan-binding domain
MDEGKLRVAALQGVLQAAGTYRLRVDGIVGRGTRTAIKANPEVARLGADVIGGDILQQLIDESTVDERKMIDLITQAALEFDEDATPFVVKAKTESSFDPRVTTPSGTYKGLFQMSKTAWDVADRTILALGHSSIGSYSANWSDPLQNSRAAVGYSIALAAEVKNLGYKQPLSESERYIAHQQGAYGLVRLKKAAAGQQLAPKDSVDMTRNMRTNPPQDGLGVTVDPAEFLTRWDDVFTKRYAEAVA